MIAPPEGRDHSCMPDRKNLSEFARQFELPLLTAFSYMASGWPEPAAWADDLPAAAGITYNGAAGEDFLKNAAGAAYVVLVGFFLYRVLARRAKRAREQVSREQSMQSSYGE